MQVALQFLSTYWLDLLILAIILLGVYIVIEVLALLSNWPKDTSGNGITIGRAKTFDNRSLALRIESVLPASQLDIPDVVRWTSLSSQTRIRLRRCQLKGCIPH
jgi:hypothetical protein